MRQCLFHLEENSFKFFYSSEGTRHHAKVHTKNQEFHAYSESVSDKS